MTQTPNVMKFEIWDADEGETPSQHYEDPIAVTVEPDKNGCTLRFGPPDSNFTLVIDFYQGVIRAIRHDPEVEDEEEEMTVLSAHYATSVEWCREKNP